MDRDKDKECSECRKLIETVIDNFSSVSNRALAVGILNRIEGLEIDDEGNVEKGARPENVKKAVVILKDTVGPVALRFIRDSVEKTSPSRKVLDKLPEDYKRKS